MLRDFCDGLRVEGPNCMGSNLGRRGLPWRYPSDMLIGYADILGKQSRAYRYTVKEARIGIYHFIHT